METKLYFREFVSEMKDELDEFGKFWAARSKEDPVTWPLDMTPGEWDEQFKAWLDTALGAQHRFDASNRD